MIKLKTPTYLSSKCVLAALLAAFITLLFTSAAQADNTISFDFETAGQWTGNFRTLNSVGTGSMAQTTVSGTGLFRLDSTGGSQAGVFLFDQTPLDSGTGTDSGFAVTGTMSVSFDARTSINGSAFCVFFINPANFNDNVVAILNINGSGTVDQLRFFKDCNTNSGSLGGTQMGGGNYDVGVDQGSTWVRFTVNLTVSGSTPTLTINCGGQTVSSSFVAGDFTWATRTLVGVRLYDNSTASSSVDIDNLTIVSPSAPDNPPAPPAPNVAPVLPSQNDRTIGALNPLTVNNTATDDPAQTLSYQLTAAPAGASISSNGVISWTPTMADISATPYTFTTVVTDNGSPALSASNSFQVTVLQPTGWTQTLDFSGSSQVTSNFRSLMTFAGGSSGYANVSGTGMFRFDCNASSGSTVAAYLFDQTPSDTTLATQSCFDTASPVTVSMDVRAVTTDSSVSVLFADPDNPSNNISAVFNIDTGNDTVRFFKDGIRSTSNFSAGTQVGSTVSVSSSAEPGTAAAFTNLSVTLTRDGSQPTLSVTVGGVSTPVTCTFPKGTFTWGRTSVILRVYDAGTSTSSTPVDIDNFTLVASGAPISPVGPNTAPVFAGVTDRSISAGRLLMVANPAYDFDSPAQSVTYSLAQAPTGATISNEGIIYWRPTAGDVSATPYTITTVATDNGSPALSATNSFAVTVTAAQSLGAFTSEVDFSGSNQFERTFRPVTDVGGGTDQTVGSRLMFDATSNGGNQSGVFLFDSTPGDTSVATQSSFSTTSPVTVSFSVRATVADSNVGVIFAHPYNAADNVSATFTIKDGADQIRFYKDGTISERSSSTGTQVGSSVDITSAAEPGYLEYTPVTVTLSVSGSTPTITVKVGDAAPVTSTFSAGDIDWTNSLVYLRLNDNSVSINTPIEINDILVAGATPTAPPAGTFAPAPGADGNLLTVNPGFEAVSFTYGAFTDGNPPVYSFTGWEGQKAAYMSDSHRTVTGSVAAGTTTEGTRAYHMDWGGGLWTAPTARAAVVPGQIVQFSYDQRSLVRNFPSQNLGTGRFIDFFDSGGVRIKQVWGTNADYRVQYTGSNATNVWETFTLTSVVPNGAAYVGVRFDVPIGQFISSTQNYTLDRHVELDNIRLTVIPEAVDRLSYRRLPRLVEPGKTATLKINHASVAPRILRAALVDGSGSERAATAVNVPAGRFRATPLGVAIPANLANNTYAWKVELLPTGGGPAVASISMPGVICDETVSLSTAANGRDFDSDHANIQFMGRIDNSNPKQQWLHWFGSEVRVRFNGTSIALRGALSPNGFGGYTPVNIVAVIDDDFPNTTAYTLSSGATFVQTLASGLTDGVHTLRIMKSAETDQRLRVDGFRTDANRGLLKPEPMPTRRLEIFGDSVTSGGSSSIPPYAYAPLLGRELDCDTHIVSKGGTGVAASFSGQDILVHYYNNLDFSNVFNASSGTKYDMTQWTPDMVVCGIGHNDQFNGGPSTFVSRYAEFKGYIRTAYPNAQFLTINTLISANLGMWQGAVDPLIAVDSKHTFAFQPNSWNDSNTGHPPTDGHIAMVYGDEKRCSFAEIVEDRMGWGLNTPLNSYEQWAAAQFSRAEIVAGKHAQGASTDGTPNMLRFALGAPGHGPVGTNLQPACGLDGNGHLTMSFNRSRSDVNYIVETSDDLVTWQTAAVNPGTPLNTVLFTDTNAAPGVTKRFVRLRVQPAF